MAEKRYLRNYPQIPRGNEMIDEKRLVEIEKWHNDKSSADYLSHEDFDGLIRLARLGIWAERFAIDRLQAMHICNKNTCSVCANHVLSALASFPKGHTP